MRSSLIFLAGLGAVANAQITAAPGVTTGLGSLPTDLAGVNSYLSSLGGEIGSELGLTQSFNPSAFQSLVSSYLANPSAIISAADGLASSGLASLSAQAATATGSAKAQLSSLIGELSSAQASLSTVRLPTNTVFGGSAVSTSKTSTGGVRETAIPAAVAAMGGVGLAVLGML